MNWLFTKQDIKIDFQISRTIPLGCYICAVAVFKTPEVTREIVTTYLKHKANIDGEYQEHFRK